MKRIVWLLLVTVLVLTNCAFAVDTYKIGVLAKRGPVKAMEQWKATADFLTSHIVGKEFKIVPLGFDEVNPAIEKGTIDFFLVNSSMFVTAKVKYGAAPIATMINSRQGQPLKAFGGVILTLADNGSINKVKDLKGKTFMAVEKGSFGGWQMAYKEMLDAGIDPFKDCTSLQFGGKHDNVVLAVQNGAIDAGTVRTDTLERMAAEGLVDLSEFKIISKKDHVGFPFVCSTPLYPEWPLAKIKKTSDALAEEVVAALTKMASTEKAAKDAKIVGWTSPLDYGPVEDLQKSLKVGAYAAN
ncbi:MAG: phosphate/phosphite/phosphonate ABC transporter substrate-binding protein [Candidatus Coatesbacteria bacterium]|nr:phosphate/phosphite/phosphonate ABC transporter substrate-binding protein [Candidatus Coatesbacteria bacterium]